MEEHKIIFETCFKIAIILMAIVAILIVIGGYHGIKHSELRDKKFKDELKKIQIKQEHERLSNLF